MYKAGSTPGRTGGLIKPWTERIIAGAKVRVGVAISLGEIWRLTALAEPAVGPAEGQLADTFHVSTPSLRLAQCCEAFFRLG